jgi:hypothetical protein
MNKLVEKLAKQATSSDGWLFDKDKFAQLIVRECNQAVLEVPVYYKDYRDQIEKAVIHDCARAVLEKFGVEE